MKRIEGNILKDYKCPYLYLSDIQEIINILKEANIKNISIVADGYIYESLKELAKNRKNAQDFQISTTGALKLYITIKFTRNEAHLYIGSDDFIARGIFTRIDEVIRKRERKILWILTVYNIFGNLFLGTFFGLIFSFDKENPNYLLRNLAFVFLFIAILWITISSLIHFKFYSVINLKEKIKIPIFFIRKKDDIVIATIFMVIGIILGIFIQRLLLP